MEINVSPTTHRLSIPFGTESVGRRIPHNNNIQKRNAIIPLLFYSELLLKLHTAGTQLPLSAAQADKVASYLLTRRTVPTAKGVLALLEAAHVLADSQLSPVSISIVADRPELRVYVGDLLGRPIRAAAPVVAQSATRLADDVVVLAKQPLSPGSAQGEFSLPLKLEPSLYKIVLNTANGASASFDVRVLGPMEVHWLEADAGQRLVVRISLSRLIHQVFLRLAHRDDGREIIFVAEPETGGASTAQDAKIYKVEVSPGEELAVSGLYDMEAILGDSVITNPVKWNIGQVDVNLEIQHQFRPKDRRPPALVSYLFTGLTAAPWLVLLVLWARIGAGIDTSKFHVTLAIPYHLSLAAVLALYTLFWLKLDMFTTCGWLAPLGAVTFLTGHRLLTRLAADRTVKEKPENIKTITDTIVESKERINRLETSVKLLERKLRRNNIVIFGLQIKNKDNLLLETLDELKNLLSIGDINNIFQVDKNTDKSPIILEFISLLKKQLVFKQVQKLKGTGVAIANDQSHEDRQLQKKLVHHVKQAKQQNLHARIRGTRLEVANRLYTIDELNSIENGTFE
nr:unnamed protein product [Callosobruchus analis]